jgi:PleD family two-component response regulator
MVLALVDDLMFRSKIKSAAQHAAVAVSFAGSRDAALAAMRATTPALVIFDLNNMRSDPLGTVAEMKKDAALTAIPTVGYVSHVDVNTIEAARAAGVDEVLARSAFTARLAELVAYPPPGGGQGGGRTE